ncbi:hypothetical protein ACTXT7_001083 [Hymenolepis weldensis]
MSSYSVKPSGSVEIRDLTAAEDVTKYIPKFIYDPKSGKMSDSDVLFPSLAFKQSPDNAKNLFVKTNGGNPNVKLQEMDREGVKLANPTRDLVLIDSDPMTMPLWYCCTLDDIIAVGRPQQELQECIVALLQLIQEYGFRLQAEKYTYFVPSIKYLGCILDKR